MEVSELSTGRQPAPGGVDRSIHEADCEKGRSGRTFRRPQASMPDEHSGEDHNGDMGTQTVHHARSTRGARGRAGRVQTREIH